MTLKQATLSLGIALVLALTASLISLPQLLPLPLVHFLVALAAAALAVVLAGKREPAAARQRKADRAAPPEAGAARSNSRKEQGNVKWFSASKGFGFITRDSGEDIFVHFRCINSKGNRVLREGQRVEFSIGNGSKGLQAEDVTALQ